MLTGNGDHHPKVVWTQNTCTKIQRGAAERSRGRRRARARGAAGQEGAGDESGIAGQKLPLGKQRSRALTSLCTDGRLGYLIDQIKLTQRELELLLSAGAHGAVAGPLLAARSLT